MCILCHYFLLSAVNKKKSTLKTIKNLLMFVSSSGQRRANFRPSLDRWMSPLNVFLLTSQVCHHTPLMLTLVSLCLKQWSHFKAAQLLVRQTQQHNLLLVSCMLASSVMLDGGIDVNMLEILLGGGDMWNRKSLVTPHFSNLWALLCRYGDILLHSRQAFRGRLRESVRGCRRVLARGGQVQLPVHHVQKPTLRLPAAAQVWQSEDLHQGVWLQEQESSNRGHVIKKLLGNVC